MNQTVGFAALRRGLTLTLAGLALVASVGGAAKAQTIVTYPFTTPSTTNTPPLNPTDPAYQPSFLSSNITASLDFTLLDHFRVGADGDPTNDVVLQTYPISGDQDVSQSIANGRSYWTLTIQAQNGFAFSASQLNYDVGKGGALDPRSYAIRSSIDAFATNLIVENPIQPFNPDRTHPENDVQGPLHSVSVNLTNPQFNLLTNVVFRFYVATPENVRSVDWRNLSLNGAVIAIPEPASATLAFLPLGILALARLRRRR